MGTPDLHVCHSIGQLLSQNSTLTSLDLRCLVPEDFSQIEALAGHVLRSCRNGRLQTFGDVPMRALFTNDCSRLDLQDKFMGVWEETLLAGLLESNTSLTSLDLRNNKLSGRALAPALRAGGASGLRRLALGGNPLGEWPRGTDFFNPELEVVTTR